MLNFLEWVIQENDRVNHLIGKYPSVKPEKIQAMLKADSAQGKSLEWMVLMVANRNIRIPEDIPRLQKALTSFYKINKKPTLLRQYNTSLDLNQYTIQSLEELSDRIEGVVAARPESLIQIPNNAKKVYDDGVIAVVDPVTPENAVILSKGTKWCTSGKGTANEYTSQGTLLVWYQNGHKFAQSFHNKNDEHYLKAGDIVSVAEKYGIKLSKKADNEYIKFLNEEGDLHDEQFTNLQDEPITLNKELERIWSLLGRNKRTNEDKTFTKDVLNGNIIKCILTGNPSLLKLYYLIFPNVLELEQWQDLFQQDKSNNASWVMMHKNKINLDDHLLKNPMNAALYARYHKRRIPELEPTILQSPEAIYSYMRDFDLNWKEGIDALNRMNASDELMNLENLRSRAGS